MRWLRSWFRDLRDPHVMLSSVLRETRTKLAQDSEIKPPTFIKGMETRDRDLTHEYSLNDVLAKELREERERKAQPGNRVIQIRSVRS